MTDIFRPMKINVPGLLGDDALREQLKQFANEKNIEQAAAPLPSGAVEMADKVQRDFLSQPGSVLSMAAAVAPAPFSPLLQTAALGMRDAPAQQRDPVLAAQDTAIDVRSDILAGAVDKLTPDFISEIGNMTDPERQAEADAKLKTAEARASGGLEADLAETQRKRDAAIASGRDPDSLDFMRDPETVATDRARENAAFDKDMRDSAAKTLTAAKAQAANKELQPTQTWWMNAIQKGVSSGYMTLTGALGGVAGGYELTMGRVFNGGDIRRSDMRAWINTVEATVNKTIPGDPLRAQEFLTQLAEGGGSFASYALGGLALRAAGLPAAASTAGIGFFSGANTGLVDAERFNAVGVQKYMAYMLNGALGITEAWPINRMFMRAEAATGGLVSRLLNQTVAEGLEEFVQELGQSVGHDVVAKWVYDAQREFDASKYIKQAAVGGLTGGIAGGAAAVLSTSPAANPALRVDPKLKARLDALTPDKQTSLIDNTIAAAQAQLDAIVPDAPVAEQASVAPATSMFEGPGGTIPVREDGLMELSHWSSAPRDVIDPAMRGTGPLRGQEQNRIGRKSYGNDPDTDIVDRSYYGVGDPFFAEKFAAEQAGLPAKERRRLSSTDPYHREGLGGVRHTVAVDPATIYNWYDDPLNLRAQLDKTTPASEQVTRYERLIKDAGFKGAYFSESDLGQTAILFDKATPEKITDDYYGMDPKEIATPDDFKQLKPETFAKGGWAVITGIQEAQGEHNSPANVEANKKLENVLKRNGIKYQVVSGAYKGVDQGKSFLIFAPEKVAKQLGERFKQESILTRKGLEYTDGRVTPVDPAGTIIGPEAAKQDFYSTLPDGTAFTMGLNFDATTEPNAAELQSMYGMRSASAGDVTQTPEFKEWFGASKVVDESGEPLVVYHGTDKAFRKVDMRKGAQGVFWVTSDKQQIIDGSAGAARRDVIMEFYASIVNPAGWAEYDKYSLGELEGRGFDGVMLPHGDGSFDAIVFEPTQIKSVDNAGAFDPANPDILAMVAKPDRVAKLVTQVAGLKGVIKHMAPDEQAKLKKSNAQAIVDIFSKLPDPKEMAAVAFSGRAKKGWYQRSAEALVDVFGLNDAPRFAALLAALSPQTSVENNAVNALWMWTNWIKAGRPTQQARIVALLGQSVMGSKGADSVLPAWINNTVTALTSEDPMTTTLSGPKVNSFMLNLQGVVHEVTNDAWMANFANVDQTLFRKTGPAPGKGAGYMAMAAAVRKAADVATKMTGETWTPAEIQETVWSWAKTLYEKATSKGELRSAAEIIAAGGMTAEEISATPDFASLFVAGAYRNILEKGGYNVDNLESRSRGADGSAERGGDPVSAEGSGFTQSAFDANLRRAAKRLDALRERRAAQTDVETFSLDETFDMGLADQPGDTDPFAGFTADDRAFMESGGLFASRGVPVRTDPLPMFPDRNDQSFDRWFGKSKVKTSRGKPKMVFHGTTAKEGFNVFDPAKVGKTSFGLFGSVDDKKVGFYFADSERFATSFAEQGVGSGKIIPAFLRVEKPLDVRGSSVADASAFGAVIDRVAEKDARIDRRFYRDRLGRDDFWELLTEAEGGELLVEAAKELGYDGIRMLEPNHDTGETESVWVVFDNTQIKSAEENTGAYDPSNPDIYAMASPRAAYKGELTRPKKGVPMQPGDEGIDAAEAGIAKVGQNFVKLLGLTTRLGRFTLKGSDIMGQFSTKQAVVRLRSNKDVSTLVHEGGHAMQAAAAPPLADFIKRNATALMKAAADMYGGDLSKADNKTKVAEGFAEFFRVYTLGRAYAVRKYPALTADFTTTLSSYAPELKTGLEAVGTQFEAWALKLPSAKVLEGMVVTGRVDTGLNAALADLREAGFGTWMQEVTRTAVENSVNRNAGLNSLVSSMLNLAEDNKGAALDLKLANDPRVLVRLAGNAGARAMVQTTDGVMPYRSVEAKTRGLREALALSQGYGADANVGKIDPVRQKAFAAYVVSLRGVDEFRRKAEGKIRNNPLGDSVTLAELQQTVKDYEAAYGTDFTEAAAIMHEYGMALWKKAFDAGLMSKDAYLAGQDRQFYVPLQRDMTDLQANPGLGGARADGGRSIVKTFKGSGRDVIDPMDVLMHKTFSLEQAIAKNDVVKALATLSDRTGQAGALVERIPASQMVAKGYSVEEIAKALTKDKDLSAEDAQDLMDMLDTSIAENNMLNLFRAEQAKTKGENILFFWEQGKVSAIQLVDGDLGADVVNLMNGVGPENFHFLVELVSSISGAFRSSITMWPDFLAVNFIRDQFNAYSMTDVGYIPFVTGLRGVGDELRQRSWAKQYNAAMGVMGGMNVASLHNAAVARDINALRKRGYIAKAFNEDGFAGMAKGMANMVELSETGTRIGVFRKAFERAKKDGLTDWEASIEASYLATDLLDYGLNGSRMALFRRTIPFLNAQVQGLYKLVRTLGGDEVRQRKGLAFVLKAYTKSVNNLDLSRAEKQAINTGRKAWVKMASLALLSAALHFIFEDDPDYQDASEYMRATGWVIPMGDGRIFYIPKPFELALLANFTERALETASGDTGAKARFLRGLAMNMVPPTSPPAIKVAVEEFMNKDSFAGRAIVPTDEIGMPPQMQYDEYTTDLAKRIGEATGLSPRRVDHVMSGLGASAYRDISSMFNSLNPNRPTKDADEMPFFRRFVRDARRGSATSRDFWKEAALTAGVYDGAANAYQKLLQSSPEGRAANEFLGTLDEDLKAYAVLDNHFPAGVKRFHPYYRGRQVAYIVSAMRRELISDIGLEDTTTKVGEPILLTASLKAKVDDELSEYARREMRNSMVAMKATGWADKEPMDLQGTIDMLEALDPRVSDELLRRMKAEKVVSSEMVQEYWPEVKNRLLTDGADANFIDVLTIAKAMQ